MTEADWQDSSNHVLGMLIRVGASGEIEGGGRSGEGGGGGILLLLNGGGRSKPFTLPNLARPGVWTEVLDTSGSQIHPGTNRINLAPHSLVLLRSA